MPHFWKYENTKYKLRMDRTSANATCALAVRVPPVYNTGMYMYMHACAIHAIWYLYRRM